MNQDKDGIDWAVVVQRQEEIASIFAKSPRKHVHDEAASEALFHYIQTPDSTARPAGVFKNCVRNVSRTLLR